MRNASRATISGDESRLVTNGKRSQRSAPDSPSALVHIHMYNLPIFGTGFPARHIYRLESHSSRLARSSSLVVVVIVTVIVGGALV